MEPILFVIGAYLVALLALARGIFVFLRDHSRERRMNALSKELIGQRRETAMDLLGKPYSVSPGHDRTLIEWKSPPSDHFPGGSGLLIFYVVVDSDGWIVQSSWQTRSERKWRSGSAAA